MQRNSKPIAWRPKGITDTLDSSSAFVGAMQSLQNLVPDPSTRSVFQCRPAGQVTINFATSGGGFSSGFSSGFQTAFSQTPIGAISLLKIIGNFAYGMIATNRNPGNDEPFCYNLLTKSIVVISGVTSANTPTSPATTGAWVPPTAALIGADLIVTHPGFTGTGGAYFGILNISNPSAPSWSAGNLTGGQVSFTTPPSAVSQFNSRAYYITNNPAQPAVVFSDSLNAVNVTNADQVLTFGDTVFLTALGQLMLYNQLGGIVQSLIVFKGAQNIYQITGDAATSNLTINALSVATGTLAPNSLCNTPKGLAFMAPDGIRLIGFTGQVSEPIGVDGQGVVVPFINSVVPSRVAAACGGSLMRVTTQNGNAPGSPTQEYWYDLSRQIWTGPHTLPMSLVQAYNGTFIGQPTALPGQLWQSDVQQSTTSTFVENGSPLVWNYVTSMLPDTDHITNNSMTESTLDLGLATGIPNITVNALDQNGTVLNTASIATPSGGTIWDAFTWGSATWGNAISNLTPYQLPWTAPIGFTRIQLQATGQSAQGIRLGAMHLRYQILRTFINQAAA